MTLRQYMHTFDFLQQLAAELNLNGILFFSIYEMIDISWSIQSMQTRYTKQGDYSRLINS